MEYVVLLHGKKGHLLINLLPSDHEIDGEDDIRVNILGLEVIAQLGLLEPIMDLPAVRHA